MKNTKEVQTILTAILCINQTSEHKDEDIAKILDYAFRRLFGSNTNLLTLCCVGRTKEEILSEIMQIMEQDTEYKKYLEEYRT